MDDDGGRRFRILTDLALLIVLATMSVALASLVPAGIRDLDGLSRVENGAVVRGYRDPVTGRFQRRP